MELRSLATAEPFTTKDGSTIRELHHTPVQSLAEATLEAGQATQRHYHAVTEEIYLITRGGVVDGLDDLVTRGQAVTREARARLGDALPQLLDRLAEAGGPGRGLGRAAPRALVVPAAPCRDECEGADDGTEDEHAPHAKWVSSWEYAGAHMQSSCVPAGPAVSSCHAPGGISTASPADTSRNSPSTSSMPPPRVMR